MEEICDSSTVACAVVKGKEEPKPSVEIVTMQLIVTALHSIVRLGMLQTLPVFTDGVYAKDVHDLGLVWFIC